MAEQCLALCDFEAGAPDELSFAKGERITVVAKGGDAGFWEGIIDAVAPSSTNPTGVPERQGRFPSCMVTSNMNPDRDPVFVDKAMALYDYVPQDEHEMLLMKGDTIAVVRQHPSSPGWWYGINESDSARKGRPINVAPSYTPGSATKRKSTAAAGTPGNDDESRALNSSSGPSGSTTGDPERGSEPLIFPSNFVTCRLVMALFPFQGRHAHELSFQVKDVIQLHRKWNDGWWEGSLRGKRGIFPSNYTAPNVATLETPLFCQKCKTVFTPSSWECKECARNEEIINTMLQALDDHVKGVGTSTSKDGAVDLFAYVDMDPSHGKGSLLTVSDTLDKNTIGPRSG